MQSILIAAVIAIAANLILFRVIPQKDGLRLRWHDSRLFRFVVKALSILPIVIYLIFWTSSFAWQIFWEKFSTPVLLYEELEPGEYRQISQRLDQLELPHAPAPDSTGIFVDRKEHREIAMKLAGESLPVRGNILFEGEELEWELEKTLEGLEGIDNARVQIIDSEAIGETWKATVVLDFVGTADLTPDDSVAVAHLVSSSVPELEKEHVKILSQQTPPEDAIEWAEDPGWLERDLEKRVQKVLVEQIGEGHSEVSINLLPGNGPPPSTWPGGRGPISMVLILDKTERVNNPETGHSNMKEIPPEMIASLIERARHEVNLDESRGDEVKISLVEFSKEKQIQDRRGTGPGIKRDNWTEVVAFTAKFIGALVAIAAVHFGLKAIQRGGGRKAIP